MAQTQAVNKDNVIVQRAAPQERLVREQIALLTGGMRTDKTPNELAPNEAVYIQNLALVAGELGVDTGYLPFGSTYAGMAQSGFQVFYSDGTTRLFLVTTRTFYIYNVPVSQWQLAPFNVIYNTAGGGGAGTTSFTLASAAGLVVGNLLGVTLDDGSQLIGAVTGIAGAVVTLDTAVPTGRTFANGATVALGITLNGDTSNQNQVNQVIFPANDFVIVSNCIDPLFYYDRVGNLVRPLPGLPANTSCHAMLVAHEQLLIASTIEAGTNHPHRLRASDQADPTNWLPTSLGGAPGIQAIYDLLDTEDFILQLLVLGPWVIVYRDSTIMRGSYLGLPNATWFWEYMIYDEGVISQKGATEIGAIHAFVGKADVYTYDGSYQVKPIGTPIFFSLLSNNGELNPAAKLTVFTQYVKDFNELWIFFPGGSEVYPSRMLRAMIGPAGASAWFHRQFADQFVGIAPVVSVAQYTWATIPGTWLDHPEPWDSRTFTQNVPTFLICKAGVGGVSVDVLGAGTGGGDVLGTGPGGDTLGAGPSAGVSDVRLQLYDYSTPTDSGTIIPWYFVSKQFGDADIFTRWERLTLYCQGSIDTLQYSIDEGDTWTTFETAIEFSPTTPMLKYAYIDYSATRIQFKAIGTDATFQFRYARLDGIVESDW